MSEKVELKKNLGLLNCVNLIVGIIIGSGIFISPKGVVQEVDSVGLSLVVWIATGIFSMFGAMAYSELGAMIPKAGGEYEYLMVAFGPLYGFLFVWSFVIIIIPASFALSALTFADYILKPIYDTCDAPLSVRLLLGATSIMFVMFINCWSVKVTNAIQNIFTVAKIAGLLIIIGLGIYSLSMGKFDNFQNAFENSSTNPGKIALAFYAGLYSYSGWSYLNYVVEEIKNPQKVLPLAITIGLGIVIVIYVFANFAYFTLLTPREMVASSAVAFSFCEKIMGKSSVIIAIFVALSSLGYVNGGLFSASRTMFGAARNSHMPTILSLINIKFLTPMISIIFLSAFSLICCFIEDTFVLLKMTMLTEYIFIGATVGGLLWLRKKNPDAERPIKINIFFPVTFLVLCILMVVMTIIISPQDSILCLLIIAIGIPVYLIFIKLEKPESLQRKIANFNVAVQKLTYSVFDESKQE